MSSRTAALSKVRGCIVLGPFALHSSTCCSALFNMLLCNIAAFAEFSARAYLIYLTDRRNCYWSRSCHEYAHEERQVHSQRQKPRVFRAPFRSRQHGVTTFPFIIILFLFASSHSIFFVPCASYACVDQILLLSLECKVRCYILPDTLRFALCCLVKPFSNSLCASLSFFFTFLSAWTCSLLTIRLVSEKRSAYFLFFFFC